MTDQVERRFALYGFGSTGQHIADFLIDQGLSLDLIIDKNKGGRAYRDRMIIAPEDIKQQKGYQDLTCIIGLHNHYIDINEVNATLEPLGFRQVVSLVQLTKMIPTLKLQEGYWLDENFNYEHYENEITQLYNLVSDEESKRIIKQILTYRKNGELQSCPSPSLFDEYTPIGLPRYEQPLRLIDCGAFTGVAIDRFTSQGYEFESIAAFEPDSVNFEKLTKKKFAAKEAMLFPLGVWSSNTQLRFENEGAMSSRISDVGETMIQCVSIDSILPDFQPNLIKFDVEGAEIEALRGMEKTIKSVRPALCVSLYHTPAHLFEIPLLIASWNLNYRFHVRVHGYNTFGVVLYCFKQD